MATKAKIKQYHYTVTHLPSGQTFNRTVDHYSMREGILIYNLSSFNEVIRRWNDIASRQPTLQWEYKVIPI